MIYVATWIALIGFVAMACFQLLLALGAPLGHMAWGGVHRRLPASLRFGSLIAIGIYLVGILAVLDKTGRTSYFGNPEIPGMILWGLTGLFGLSILGNLASKSRLEKQVMTPVAILFFASCLVLAMGG